MSEYRELQVTEIALELVDEIYSLTQKFPKEELYGLTNQIRRAAVSIPSNISEGQARQTDKEFINFMYYAMGFKAEVRIQLRIALRLGYVTKEEVSRAWELQEKVSKMLSSLIQRRKSKI